MVTVDATAREHDGVTLVTAFVAGGPVPTRVTLHNRLDGPVWPPRRTGEPVAGWDEAGYEAVVPAGERVALGYACPAPPVDPPLKLVATERAPTDEDGDFDSPSAVLRSLGSPAPPRDAVPLPEPGDEVSGASREAPVRADQSAVDPARFAATDRDRQATSDGEANRLQSADLDRTERSAPDLPDPVLAWFERAEERIERAESLSQASDVPAATDAVRAVGLLDAAATLEDRRATDAERLREIATRANALAYRAESAAIPVETLERLA